MCFTVIILFYNYMSANEIPFFSGNFIVFKNEENAGCFLNTHFITTNSDLHFDRLIQRFKNDYSCAIALKCALALKAL